MSVSSVQTGLLSPNSTAYTPVAPAVTFVFFLGGDSRKVNFSRYLQEGENEEGKTKETYSSGSQMKEEGKINSRKLKFLQHFFKNWVLTETRYKCVDAHEVWVKRAGQLACLMPAVHYS